MAELQLCLRQKVNSVSLGVVKGNFLAQKERNAALKPAGRGWYLGLHRASLQSNWREFFSPSEEPVQRMLLARSPVKL